MFETKENNVYISSKSNYRKQEYQVLLHYMVVWGKVEHNLNTVKDLVWDLHCKMWTDATALHLLFVTIIELVL